MPESTNLVALTRLRYWITCHLKPNVPFAILFFAILIGVGLRGIVFV